MMMMMMMIMVWWLRSRRLSTLIVTFVRFRVFYLNSNQCIWARLMLRRVWDDAGGVFSLVLLQGGEGSYSQGC